jgi:metal-responsive CopG/Arc/MetJ family transcriptional regulator
VETISLKLDEEMLSNIDKSLKKNNFSTRTEFVRDAIREKLEKMTRDELIQHFLSLKGKAKTKTTDEEWEKVKEEGFKNFMRKRGWD